MSRTPACEDAAAIAARLAELQQERLASEPRLMATAWEAIRRARIRMRICTCALSEAPRPCPHRYALSDCWKAANAGTLGAAE
jgi:hypothetical protein